LCDSRIQGLNGRQHLAGQDDALGSWLFANEFEDVFALGLQHDEVARGF
jgi:hypothetical protein